MSPSKKFVPYYRVSTEKQGRSRLGLEAQRETVLNYVQKKGIVIEEFTEVESGRNKERPELLKAVQYCKQNQCCLVIAKLDRLARSVSFIFALKDAGVDFECCDLPDLNTLNLGIFAALSQYEAELISSRTKLALRAKKQQGFTLGNPKNLTQQARIKGGESLKRIARQKECNQKAFEFARDHRARGESYGKIAEALNRYRFETPQRKKFYPCSVRNLFKLYTNEESRKI